MLITLLAIALGGAVGALLRFGLRELVLVVSSEAHLPVATLLANGIGCLLAGLFLALWQTHWDGAPEHLRQGIMIGVLGALTTFSTFSVETMSFVEQSLWFKAAGNVLANLLLSLLMVFVGAWLGGKIAAIVNTTVDI